MKKEQSNVASLEPNVDSLRSNVASKEPQNLAWACLPKEARDQIRDIVKTSGMGIHGMFDLVFGGNVTSDVEPEEMLMVSKKRVLTELCRAVNLQNDKEEDWIRAGEEIEFTLMQLFGDKCLPDKEQPKPKFNLGDKVEVDDEDDERIYTVIDILEREGEILYKLHHGESKERIEMAHLLKLYTEPKNMEEKELNLCELLKGCEGEEFYSPAFGNIQLEEIEDNNLIFKEDYNEEVDELIQTDREGVHSFNGMPIIYPSRALYEKYPLDAYAAWMEWKEARKPKRWTPQIGERIFFVNTHGAVSQEFCRSDEEGNEYQLKRRAIGNEFRTGKAAETFAKIFRETLAIFHEKNAGRDI